MRWVVWALGTALSSVCVAAAPAVAADRLVTTDPGANVDAFNGSFGWSQAVAGCQPGSIPCVSRLELFSHGVRRFAPVRSFAYPWPNPKLGPGRDGSTVATYSRCNAYFQACDLFVLGLRSGHERKLRSLSTPDRSEFAIAGWRRRYLFARDGRRGGLFATRPLRRIAPATLGTDVDLDLRGRVAAFTVATDPRFGDSPFNESVRVVRLSRRGVSRQCAVSGDGVFVTDVVLTRRFVYWVESSKYGAGQVVRRRIPSRRCVQRGPAQVLRGGYILPADVAVTRGRVFYARGTDLLEMTDPLVRDP